MNRRTVLGGLAVGGLTLAEPHLSMPWSGRRYSGAPLVLLSGADLGQLSLPKLEAGAASSAAQVLASIEAEPHLASVGLGAAPGPDGRIRQDAGCLDASRGRYAALLDLQHVLGASDLAARALDWLAKQEGCWSGDEAYRLARLAGEPHRELLTREAHSRWIADQSRRGLRSLPETGPEGSPAAVTPGTESSACAMVLLPGGDLGLAGVSVHTDLTSLDTLATDMRPGVGLAADKRRGAACFRSHPELVEELRPAEDLLNRLGESASPQLALQASLTEFRARVAERSDRQRWFDGSRPRFAAHAMVLRADGQHAAAGIQSSLPYFAGQPGQRPRPQRLA